MRLARLALLTALGATGCKPRNAHPDAARAPSDAPITRAQGVFVPAPPAPPAPRVTLLPIEPPAPTAALAPAAPSVPPAPCVPNPRSAAEHRDCGMAAMTRRDDARALLECHAMERDPALRASPDFWAFRAQLNRRIDGQVTDLRIGRGCAAARARAIQVVRVCAALRPSIGDDDTCQLPSQPPLLR